MAAEKNFFDDKNNFARDDFYHRKPYIDHFGSFLIERFEALISEPMKASELSIQSKSF